MTNALLKASRGYEPRLKWIKLGPLQQRSECGDFILTERANGTCVVRASGVTRDRVFFGVVRAKGFCETGE